MLYHFFTSFLLLLAEMAPYLLLGFFIAGLMHAFVPQRLYHAWLGPRNSRSVLLAILFGVPLPLCSCGVIPTAVSMRKEGASKGATTAFLIATPQTGVDSIAATYSVLGLPFAILRPVVAMVTGLFGGLAVNLLDKRGEGSCVGEGGEGGEGNCANTSRQTSAGQTFSARCLSALSYGFSDMIQDIGRWLVIGLVIAALITVLVPDGFFTSYASSRVLNLLLVLLIAAPMYVCATGSIPIAAALMMKGLSPGAALVFLMAGPATNIASVMVLGKTLGRRSLLIYLLAIVLGAVGFGLAVDIAASACPELFAAPHSAFHSACCHEEIAQVTWWQQASAVAMALLLVRALWLRFKTHGAAAEPQAEAATKTATYKIDGMMCNHCRASVERALTTLDGVEEANVDLAAGTATVTGPAEAEKVIAAVKSCGYSCIPLS